MSDEFVEQCCDKATELISSGNLNQAAKILKRASARDPSNSKVIALLSLIAGKSEQQPKRRNEMKRTCS